MTKPTHFYKKIFFFICRFVFFLLHRYQSLFPLLPNQKIFLTSYFKLFISLFFPIA